MKYNPNDLVFIVALIACFLLGIEILLKGNKKC